MIDLGSFSLTAACLLSVYSFVIGIFGAINGNFKVTLSARNSFYMSVLFAVTAFFALALAFLTHDYRYAYVWKNSNNDMQSMYLISAIWGGMDGSMLLWAVMMGIFSVLAISQLQKINRNLINWVIPILAGATGFFFTVVVMLSNPFRIIPSLEIPVDGNGLNPLLQNPSMMIHPPMLYAGFTGLVIPFAFSLAALISGNLTENWVQITRRWTLIAWGFLTLGIILGGNWAYIELGWGGFWAWDPVENASFLPWLSATAYLHSAMVQERRGMLKVWNISLAVLSYLLSIFGTFLTRSGIVQSVHAFADGNVGWVLLLYICVILVLTISLVIIRWKDLRPENKLESYFSREAAFLFNNLILLGICFSTFWGVMFPVLSEAFTGEKSVVGPPFYNQVNGPLFLALLFLMGVGPLLAWKKSSFKIVAQVFFKPFMIGSLVTILFLVIDIQRLGAAIGFGLSTFVLWTVMGEFHRGIRARKEISTNHQGANVIDLIRRKPRRYGGFIVHLGIVVMAVSIIASTVYKIEREFVLKQNETYAVGRFSLKLEQLTEDRLANYSALKAQVGVFNLAGTRIGQLNPERRFYYRGEHTTTEVDIRMTPREDLYLALAGLDLKAGQEVADNLDLTSTGVAFKVFVNPLQMWLWVGGVIVMLGALVVIGLGFKQVEVATVYERGQLKVTV